MYKSLPGGGGPIRGALFHFVFLPWQPLLCTCAACMDDAISALAISLRFSQFTLRRLGRSSSNFQGRINIIQAGFFYKFQLNQSSRLGKLTEKQRIPIIFSLSIISSKLMGWLSWNYQRNLLELWKSIPENFSLSGPIVQEYFAKNEKLWLTRLWHHLYIPCVFI